jgi:hypothetical protein
LLVRNLDGTVLSMKYVAALALAGGVLVGWFNAVYLVFMLLGYQGWTEGSYHQPALTVLQIYGGLACAIATVAGLVAIRRGLDRKSVRVVLLIAAGAVASVCLPFLHIFEVDVNAAGFRQTRYQVVTGTSLRLYNVSDAAVRICLGARSACSDDPDGPESLRGNGLTLKPGQTTRVSAKTEGTYRLTIAEPAPGMTAVDSFLVVVAPKEDEGGPSDYW